MRGLIGDRFLKRFFRSRSHRSTDQLADLALTAPDNAAEAPAASDCQSGEARPQKQALLESESAVESHPARETQPLAAPEQQEKRTRTRESSCAAPGQRGPSVKET